MKRSPERLTEGELHELKRWNTPTIYNGWEQITAQDATRDGFNLEPTRDFMPQMGPMIGYAVTVVAQPSDRRHAKADPDGAMKYRRYIAETPGPKIVVVQDLDKPLMYGAFWGEVNSGLHRALGCVGTITDGAIRDLDEMNAAGFKALARGLCVGHAASHPVRWNCPVEVFGRTVLPGQLIHADKHGFLVVDPQDEAKLLEAARFMDSNECRTMIESVRGAGVAEPLRVQEGFEEASRRFREAAKARFARAGEW